MVNGRQWPISAWNEELVKAFAPTVVLNFAFLTRERQFDPGYVEINTKLTDQLLWSMQLPHVRCGVTLSSGAVVTEPDSPYGGLKSAEERLFRASAGPSQGVMIGRVFSLSGPFVRRPHAYAFSDFILQAAEGTVHINADQPVFRRYTDAADYLTVLATHALMGRSGCIESGGIIVEMQELAEEVVAVVNPHARILRPDLRSQEPLSYASTNVSWTQACEALGFQPLDLTQQVVQTSRGLLS